MRDVHISFAVASEWIIWGCVVGDAVAMKTLIFLFACFLLPFHCAEMAIADPQPEQSGSLRDKIVATMKRREDRIRNFQCRLSETTTYSPEWIERAYQRQQKRLRPDDREPLECRNSWTVRFDGARYFTRRDGALPNTITGGTTKDVRSTLFDGSVQTILQEPAGKREHFNAVLSDVPEDFEYLSLKPIWWFTRFFHERGMSCPTLQFSVRSDTIDVSGHSAYTVECSKGGEAFEVDRDRECLPLMYYNRSKGIPTVTVEMDYASEGDEDEWRLKAWVIKSLRNGVIETEAKVQVLEWQVNVEFEEDDFRLEIPKETLVHDRRSAKTNFAVIDLQGKQREITKRELTSGQVPAIIKGISPEKQRPYSNRPLSVFVLNILAMVCVLAAARWWRWRERSFNSVKKETK